MKRSIFRAGRGLTPGGVSLAVVLSATAAVAGPASPGPGEPLGEPPPNVLVIVVDDLGLEWTTPYELNDPPLASMPNIDALAAEGLVFERAWATPRCSPTRAALLSGQHGHRTGVGQGIQVDDPVGLPLETTTLMEMALAAGYSTGCFGKWHVAGARAPDTVPNDNGCDYFFGGLIKHVPDFPRSPYFWKATENGETEAEFRRSYWERDVADKALAWIAERPDDQPWMAYFASVLPHKPFLCPPAGEITTSCSDESSPTEVFPAMIEMLDKVVGELLAVAGEETIVLFVGDNGSEVEVTQPPFPPGRTKSSIYEGGIRVPMIWKGPGVAGGYTRTIAHVVDVLPTLAELIGGTPVLPADGDSLRPWLTDPALPANRIVYTEYWGPNGDSSEAEWHRIAASDGRYKIMVDELNRFRMYDLLEDPFEAADMTEGPLSGSEQEAMETILGAASLVRRRWFTDP